MFGKLFGKKDPERFTDKTWLTTDAKYAAIIEACKKETDSVFICWFTNTLEDLQKLFTLHNLDENRVKFYRNYHYSRNQTVYFAEHYPLRKKENELVTSWQQLRYVVFNALDEPLFQAFGSGEIQHMAQALGLAAFDSIEHSLINKAIKNAQEKIEKKMGLSAFSADSQKKWMELNYVKDNSKNK